MASKPTIGAGIALDGEKEWKSAISNINKDLAVLGSEMSKNTAKFTDNASSMDALKVKSQDYNKQIEVQKQKIEALQKALANSAEVYGEADTKTKNWQISLNKAEEELSKMESGARATQNEINNFGKNIDDAKQKTIGFGDVLKANLISQAIVSGVQQLTSSIKGMVSDVLNNADAIQQMADVTGMSAEKIQQWQYVGDNLGVSIDTITGAQKKLTKSMSEAADGTGSQSDAFEKLGVSVVDSNGNLKDAKTVLTETLSALGGVSNETERDALAMDILGKSAADLNPLIKAGADEINRLSTEAQNNGAVMSDEAVAGLDTFGDAMGNLKTALLGRFGEAFAELTPSLTQFADKIKGIDLTPVTNALKWVLDNSGTIIAGIAGIASGMLAWNVATMIQGVVGAIKAFQLANEGATIAQYALNVAMKANPLGIVITVVAALVTAIMTLWQTNENFRNSVIAIWTNISEFFTETLNGMVSIGTEIVANLKSIFSLGNEGIKNLFIGLKDGVISIFTSLASGVRSRVSGIVTSIKDGLTAAMDWISSLPDQMYNFGINMIEGLVDGIASMIKNLKKMIKKVADTITDGVKDALDINSPSKEMAKLGAYATEGLAVGLESEVNKVASAMDYISNIVKGLNADITANAASSSNTYNNATDVTFESLITVQGNIDSSNVDEVKKAVKDGVKQLQDLIKSKGVNTKVSLKGVY